ncbi:MAG: VapE domain-containing protein [Acidimicrobiia bacterium]
MMQTTVTKSSRAAITPEHQQHLLEELGERGLELALAHGARSIDADEAHRLGFRWRTHRTGGLLLPFGGDFAQLRCDNPPTDQSGRPVNYLNRAGAKQQPATFGDSSPTIATEGWKDGLAIHLRTGDTVQAIPGVTAHKALAESVIQLIYDADARDNPAVWSQLVTAGLQRRILSVGFFPAEIAGPKGGACEFFAPGGEFLAIGWRKSRQLLQELPKGWTPDIRADWKPHAIRHLARLAIRAGYGRDTVRQLAVDAAKGLKLEGGVNRARQIVAAELQKAAPPPKDAPKTAPAHVRLIATVGSGPPPEIKVYAGFWADCLMKHAGPRLRRNLLSQQTELDGAVLGAESEELLYVCAQSRGWKISKPDCYDGTRYAALQYAYHPVREYLARVADDPEIDAADLDGLAANYLGVKDALSAAMLRCLLIGAVARVHEPGCEPPGVVVLRGVQGIGKSGFWQGLGGEFYVVSADNYKTDEDRKMAMHSSWIFDLDELDKVTTAKKAASLRSEITAPSDTFRIPYAMRPEKFNRQFVIVGAVNGDGFLTDPEGNRRYWVIDCPQRKDSGQFIDGPGVKRDRDAIWKAAVLAYRSGADWRLTTTEQAASNRRNGQWEAVDEWDAPIVHWAEKTRTPGGFSTREAIDGAALRTLESIQRADEMRAAQVLRRAGFRCEKSLRTRVDGVRGRFWTVASEQPEQPRTISDAEVVHRQNACSDWGLPSAEQPEQPFSGKTQEKERRATRGRGDGLQCSSQEKSSAVQVVQVVHTTPDRLPRNGSGSEQPPEHPSEVVQRQPGQPVWVDGKPGWLLPSGVMPKGDGPTVMVLVVDPAGTSCQIERGRISLTSCASAA